MSIGGGGGGVTDINGGGYITYFTNYHALINIGIPGGLLQRRQHYPSWPGQVGELGRPTRMTWTASEDPWTI